MTKHKQFLWCPGKDFSIRNHFPDCRVGVNLLNLIKKAYENQPSELIACINPTDEVSLILFIETHKLVFRNGVNIKLSLAYTPKDREFFQEAPYTKYEVQPLE